MRNLNVRDKKSRQILQKQIAGLVAYRARRNTIEKIPLPSNIALAGKQFGLDYGDQAFFQRAIVFQPDEDSRFAEYQVTFLNPVSLLPRHSAEQPQKQGLSASVAKQG